MIVSVVVPCVVLALYSYLCMKIVVLLLHVYASVSWQQVLVLVAYLVQGRIFEWRES